MACFHPLSAFQSFRKSDSGKNQIFFSRPRDSAFVPIKLPCGQCVGCRLERSRQWALRCLHESSLHFNNSFVTLTYSDEFLPADGSLNLDHFQRFMKRLRKRFGEGIRFYHCGEYGEKFRRPHYHAIIFGLDFSDKKLWKVNNGQPLYTSDVLSSIWTYGYAVIGSVTFESAAYVARYIMKKVTGPMANDYYTVVDGDTGEVFKLKPEYTTMSRRPGIASGWYDRFKGDCYPSDFIVHRGFKVKPPKYYDRLFEAEFPSDFAKIKRDRKVASKLHLDNQTPDRLLVREEVTHARISKLVRNIE